MPCWKHSVFLTSYALNYWNNSLYSYTNLKILLRDHSHEEEHCCLFVADVLCSWLWLQIVANSFLLLVSSGFCLYKKDKRISKRIQECFSLFLSAADSLQFWQNWEEITALCKQQGLCVLRLCEDVERENILASVGAKALFLATYSVNWHF